MRKIYFYFSFVLIQCVIHSQAFKITHFFKELDSVDIQIELISWSFDTLDCKGELCLIPRLKGFSHFHQNGTPFLSSYHPWLIWDNSLLKIKLLSLDDTSFEGNFIPSKIPDLREDTNQVMLASPISYQKYDANYPPNVIEIERQIRTFGHTLVQVGIYPFQYDFISKKWIVHQKIVFRLPLKRFKLTQSSSSKVLRNIVLNSFMIEKSSELPLEGYLIITKPQFNLLADSLASWKANLGYDVRVITNHSWTTASVKDSIKSYYFRKNFMLSYVLLLGDIEVVPSNYVQDEQGFFYSDFPYALLEGNDYFPEIFIGRMPASTVAEAHNMISKTILYEQNPPSQLSYYNNLTLVANFQDDNNDTYEDRRFAQTMEEIAVYFEQQGKQPNRIYYADATDNPQFWNNDYFSAGEPVPAYLRKPFFPWNGNAYQIRTAINQGTSLLLYRGHGTVNGWSKPSFVTSNLAMLNNSLLPLVFSINCLSGNFVENDGFAEEFLKLKDKGALGVFSHVAASYSGYNDALILGMIDAMFPVPGLNPVFTGTAAQPSSITSQAQLSKPGQIAVQGLLRMTETWGNLWNLERRTFHLLHYLGDPAMEIYFSIPQTFQIQFFPYITCRDTILRIHSLGVDSVTVVISQRNKILARKLLTQQDTFLSLISPEAGTPITVVASKSGYKPQIQHLHVWGNCFSSLIKSSGEFCVGQSMVFSIEPAYTFAQCHWDFGQNAVPQIATGFGMHEVRYSSPGWKIIEVTIQMHDSLIVLYDSIWIDQFCSVKAIGGKQVVYQCSGMFQTNDEHHLYEPFSKDTVIVISPGAIQFQVYSMRFNLAQGDSLLLFNLTGNHPDLLNKYYTGNPLNFTSVSGDRFMLVWSSDASHQDDGINLKWECIPSQLPPVAGAEVFFFDPCSGTVSIKDTSRNQPEQVTWFFSDGTTSIGSVVKHQFPDTGCYQVVLAVANNSGSDTLVISPFCIHPLSLTALPSLHLCYPDTINLQSTDTLLWYVSSSSMPFYIGTSLKLWYDGQQNLLVKKFKKKDLIIAGKVDTTGIGGYLNTSSEQRLFFEVIEPVFFESFDIYSMTSQQGRFYLLSPSGDTLWKITILLQSGKNTVAVDHYLIPGEPYSLCIAPNVILFKNYFNTSFYPATYGNVIRFVGSNSINGGLLDYPGLYNWHIWNLCLSGHDTLDVQLSFPFETEEKYYYLCQGDTVRLYSRDGTPLWWMPDSLFASYTDVFSSGTYYTLVEEDSCVSLTNVIQITFLPSADEVGITYHQQGLSFDFAPTLSGLIYEWNFGDGTFSYLENAFHAYNDSSERVVTLTVYSPCGISQVDTLIFHDEVITSQSSLTGSTIIYPNPASDVLFIQSDQMVKEVIFYSFTGEKIIAFERVNDKNLFFRLPEVLSSGLYYVCIITTSGFQVTMINIIKK